MRGSWQVRLYADPKGSSIAETSVLVEDFQPERLAFDLKTDGQVDRHRPRRRSIDLDRPLSLRRHRARPLDRRRHRHPPGRNARRLRRLSLRPRRRAGRAGARADRPRRRPPTRTARRRSRSACRELPVTTRPLEAQIIVRIADTNGRAVERTLTLPVTPEGADDRHQAAVRRRRGRGRRERQFRRDPGRARRRAHCRARA